MRTRPFSHDAEMGISETFCYDDDTEQCTIVTEQDVEYLLADAHEQRKLRDKHAKYGDMSHVARIPMPVLMELQKVGIAGDSKAMLKWLELHPEYKTREGRLA